MIVEIALAIVTSFKYLGLHDTEDGAIENAVRARVIRMEYLFKQFQGRVLTNHKIDVLPRMNVFKTIMMTNRLYACKTWNYTTTDIARLERRLLRDTLLLPKNDADFTFAKVLDMAEEQGIYTVFPLECLIQRKQLKFRWKIIHLEDTAVQKLILFGKVANKGKQRRGGRKQTYISCLNLALNNFGVTMDECGRMDQTDWDFWIDNEALVKAVDKWRIQPRARKPIDNFWAPQIRTRGKRKIRSTSEDEEDVAGNREVTAVERSTVVDMSVPTNTEYTENNQENISLQISGKSTRRLRKTHKRLRKGIFWYRVHKIFLPVAVTVVIQ